MSKWAPRLPRKGTLIENLVAALEADIASGVLKPGTRLPTHRDLARALNIGIGSVTRAYTLASERRLLEARVGRGSFVARPAEASISGSSGNAVDLARNIPPLAPAERRLAETLTRIRRRPDLLETIDYSPPLGFEKHRRSVAGWIQRTGNLPDIKWGQLLLCSGAQESMSLVFSALARPGDTIMTEAATFFGMKNLAEYAGYRLLGLAMDKEGIVPSSLDKAGAKGARVLYTMPTLQNPTGRTMSSARRAEIVRIARKRNIWIVEDDIYSIFAADSGLEPLATLAPERTFYISGLSKALSPGLRVGCVYAPSDEHVEQLTTIVRARSYAPPSLGSLVAAEWIDSGIADDIAGEVRNEVRTRTALAKEILGTSLDPGTGDECTHLWLPMQELEAERLANRLARANVEITPPPAPIVASDLIFGLRLCIGGSRDRGRLGEALRAVTDSLSGKFDRSNQGVV